MKPLIALALLAIAPHVACGAEPKCDIPGLTKHWIADYCMYRAETDDFESPEVAKCFAQESSKSADTCVNRKKYKEKICELMKSEFGNSKSKCVADKSFAGPTVKNGGL
jgi:hypothetical protein